MCSVEETPISCGVNELSDVGSVSPASAVEEIWKRAYFKDGSKVETECGMIVWSDVVGRNNPGAKLKRFIEKTFKKGEVGQSFYAKNPNSKNNIRLFFWRFPKKELLKWGLSRDLEISRW